MFTNWIADARKAIVAFLPGLVTYLTAASLSGDWIDGVTVIIAGLASTLGTFFVDNTNEHPSAKALAAFLGAVAVYVGAGITTGDWTEGVLVLANAFSASAVVWIWPNGPLPLPNAAGTG